MAFKIFPKKISQDYFQELQNNMEVEYEATFENIDPEKMRETLQNIGAKQISPKFLQKQAVFNLPEGHGVKGGWLRVRKQSDKTTLSLKVVDGSNTISGQKETEVIVDNFDKTVLLLENIGCEKKADQEKTRELWQLDGVDITIDEWPFLEPFVEVESNSEEKVRDVSEKLGFDYSMALFDSVDAQYSKKYGITIDAVNQRTPKILFNMENPFINRND